MEMNETKTSFADRNRELRAQLNLVIFGTNTRAGQLFDIALILVITASLLAVMLDSVQSFSARYGSQLKLIEWTFTIIFSIEYLLRLYCSPRRWQYARSFYGIVDLLAVIPTYIAVLFPSASFLLIIRVLRVMRIFRVLKLMRYLGEVDLLLAALRGSRRKILVFLLSVLVLATVFGSILYIVEAGQHGFTSIPRSIYWAIITITTVGYGDIAPTTPLGQAIAALVTLTGYSIIAVPTGIITAEVMQVMEKKSTLSIRTIPVRNSTDDASCRNCGNEEHDADALHCKHCGARLMEQAIAD